MNKFIYRYDGSTDDMNERMSTDKCCWRSRSLIMILIYHFPGQKKINQCDSHQDPLIGITQIFRENLLKVPMNKQRKPSPGY
ncbi:MAG: hypothetical protein QM737_15845 [Ferruginibacter sp.]